MTDKQDKERSERDAELEREIRRGRKFTLAEAIGRLAGPGAMKGESPVTRAQQAEFEISNWLRSHLPDAGGPLEVVLHRRVKASDLLINNLNQPLVVLASYCQRVLSSDYLLNELVRDADVEWGRVMGERPYFEKEGSPRHPDDPYTVEPVRNVLSELLNQLAVDAPRAQLMGALCPDHDFTHPAVINDAESRTTESRLSGARKADVAYLATDFDTAKAFQV